MSYLTIKQLCEAHPCLCEDIVRKHVIESDINGLEATGAIAHLSSLWGRGFCTQASNRTVVVKDVIDPDRYFDWMYSQARLLRY